MFINSFFRLSQWTTTTSSTLQFFEIDAYGHNFRSPPVGASQRLPRVGTILFPPSTSTSLPTQTSPLDPNVSVRGHHLKLSHPVLLDVYGERLHRQAPLARAIGTSLLNSLTAVRWISNVDERVFDPFEHGCSAQLFFRPSTLSKPLRLDV